MNCSSISNSSTTSYVNPSTAPALAVNTAPVSTNLNTATTSSIAQRVVQRHQKNKCNVLNQDNIISVSTSTNPATTSSVAQTVLAGTLPMQQPEKAKGPLKQDEILPSLPTKELVQKLLAIENLPAFFAASNGEKLESLKPRFNDIAWHILNELNGNLCQAGDSKKNLLGVIRNYVTEVFLPDFYCQMTTESIAEVLDFFPAKQQVTLLGSYTTSEQYQVFAKHCHDLKMLFLDKPTQLSSETLREILKNNPKLQELHLNFGQLSDAMLFAVAEECTSLETLRCPMSFGIRGAALTAILQSNPRLHDLCFGICNDLTDDCVRAILQYGQNLQSVNLASCYKVTGESCRGPADFLNKNLKNLDLENCHYLTDAGLENILRHCPNLQRLNIPRCAGLSGHVDEKWIRQFCPHIQELILSK